MSRIAIVTDAWHPQINGVVTTLSQTVAALKRLGHQVKLFTPQLFFSIPCPTYPEIRLALARRRRLMAELLYFSPHAVHIATEGPLGWAARWVCKRLRFPFTTSYHTRFPEYIRARFPISPRISYSVLRCFHRRACRVMVATRQLGEELARRGFANVVPWSRGVDTTFFRPGSGEKPSSARPVAMFVGRVAVEKNIEAFLRLDLPGSKIIVGDGPARGELEYRYREVHFTGYLQGRELVRYLAAADVMVFPSLTDTFGVVMLEAMACGVPVAAFPVTGPVEVVQNGVNGWLNEDLAVAIHKALQVPRQSCRASALAYSWDASTRQFLTNLEIIRQPLALP